MAEVDGQVSEQAGAIRVRALAAIEGAEAMEDLQRVEREFTSKSGPVGALLASIKTAPPLERRGIGQAVNELKGAITCALEQRREALAADRLAAERRADDFDPTLPAASLDVGSLHPLTHVVRRLEEIFTQMGYAVLDGPEVELEFYNFDSLNIPGDHPAREHFDTFWCRSEAPEAASARLLMRTHTSPVQMRALERMELPFRAIVPGRCFRNETTDASHEHTFHQMEGLVVGEGITVGHMMGAMKTFLRELFQKDLEVRLRPGYFPFVEPGFELDVRCPFCADRKTRGCSVCKRSTWIELCPSGMVHPVVLRHGGVDPERYTGFAFGLGLSRLVMLRFGIDDIRHLLGCDLRFLSQF